MATDLLQRVKEAIVAILDTAAGIVAITERPDGNIVPWKDLSDATLPVLAYFIVTANEIGGIGDTRQVDIQFTASASDDSVVNALLEQVELTFVEPAFAAQNLNAYVSSRSRQPSPDEEDVQRGDLDISIIVTK